MTTYADLRADIADWLVRPELVGQIRSFIRLCESDIANDIRVRDQIRRARSSGLDTRYLALPAGYLEMRRLEMWPDSDRRYSLIQVTPENLQVLNVRDTSTASYQRPQRYTVHREIEFDAPLGTDGEVEMIYYRRYDALAADTDTNGLLLNDYGVYLYGSLLHSAPYLRNDERVAFWQAAYRRAVNQAMETERRGRVNKGEARVSISGATP